MNIINLIVSFGFLIVAMTVHEFAHGWVAYKLGDNTARSSGRLTLNPLAHIDPVGTVILPLMLFISTQGRFVFGAAKPVPIDLTALRNPKKDIIWIGLAGPLANFILAFLTAFVAKHLSLSDTAGFIVINLIMINVFLGVFNLIPIPPLDGSRVVMGLLPYQAGRVYASIEPYGFFIVMALSFMGLLDMFIYPLALAVLRLLT